MIVLTVRGLTVTEVVCLMLTRVVCEKVLPFEPQQSNLMMLTFTIRASRANNFRKNIPTSGSCHNKFSAH